MEDTHNSTPKEKPEAEIAEAIDIYARYWMEHIVPLKEDKLIARYGVVLIDAFGRIYGERAAIDLIFRFLKLDMDLRDLAKG